MSGLLANAAIAASKLPTIGFIRLKNIIAPHGPIPGQKAPGGLEYVRSDIRSR